MAQRYGADTLVTLEKLGFHLSLDPYKIYTEDEFLHALKTLYEAENQRLQEEAAIAAETEKESDFDSIRNAFRKRFSQKNPMDEFTDAIAVLDNVII